MTTRREYGMKVQLTTLQQEVITEMIFLEMVKIFNIISVIEQALAISTLRVSEVPPGVFVKEE